MGKIRDNQSGFSAVEVVLVLIIVVLVGVVGFMVYKNHHKSAKSASSTSANSGSTNKKTTADPYAGWNNYTDTAKLYSVKYPGSWTVSNPAVHADTPFTLADTNQAIFEAPNPSNTSPTEVFILAYATSNLQDVMSQDSFGDKPTTPQSMTINGYQALYGQDIETGSTGTNPTYTVDQYAVTHNGVTLLFSFREQQGNDENVGTPSASGAYNHTSATPQFTGLVKSVKFLN